MNKELWDLSGHRCGLCRRELDFQAKPGDADAGHEARVDPSGGGDTANLLLVCRDDASRVRAHDPALLKTMKEDHEVWVLSQQEG